MWLGCLVQEQQPGEGRRGILPLRFLFYFANVKTGSDWCQVCAGRWALESLKGNWQKSSFKCDHSEDVKSLRWVLSCLGVSNCAGHILNVIKLNSTVLNQILGFSVLCCNDEMMKSRNGW